MEEMKELLTSAQVAKEFGYSREQINSVARRGLLAVAMQLPTARNSKNGAYLFRRTDVEAWQSSGRAYGGRSAR